MFIDKILQVSNIYRNIVPAKCRMQNIQKCFVLFISIIASTPNLPVVNVLAENACENPGSCCGQNLKSSIASSLAAEISTQMQHDLNNAAYTGKALYLT